MKNTQRTLLVLSQTALFMSPLVAMAGGNFNALLSKYQNGKSEAAPTAQLRAKRSPTSTPAPAPVAASVVESKPVAPSEEESTFGLSGGWGGLRKGLSEKGYEFDAVYKGEWVQSSNTGLGSHGGFLGNLDLKARIDAEKAFGLSGLKFMVYGLGNHGHKPSPVVGDAQGTSNIETPYSTFKLYELFAEQSFAGGKASALLGLHDLNTEFYVTDSSGLFRNSSFGVGKELAQSGQNGPSIFPETSLALRLKANPTPDFVLQTAVFDGIPGNPPNHFGTQFSLKSSDGLLVVNEAAWLKPQVDGASLSASKYALGFWSYTAPADRDDGNGQTGNYGGYLLIDQAINFSSSVFLRHGWTYGEIADKTYASCTSLGLNYRGLIPRRGQDRLGLGLTLAATNDRARANGSEARETAFEVVYRAELRNGLALMPDYQFVKDPQASKANGNSHVFSLRAEISL